MAHIRTQIRAAIVALFSADVPGTFKRVEAERVHPIDDGSMMPCLDVTFAGERVDSRSSRGEANMRGMEFAIGVSARGSGLQDRLDVLALKVEQRMAADQTLGGLVMHIVLTATEQVLSGEAEKRTGRQVLTYQCMVATSAADPETRA